MFTGNVLQNVLRLALLRAKADAKQCLMEFYGAPTRTRTADLLITNQLLYQLSYRGVHLLEVTARGPVRAAVRAL